MSTKTAVPRPAVGLARQRLWDRLDTHPRAVVVVAPPGYGKTTVVAGWCRAVDRPAAWVSLDEADGDPVLLWRYVAAAVDAALPGHSGDLPGAATPADVITTVVPRVLNRLGSAGTDITIVLDDYHRITEPVCHRSVALVLERRPANLRLVVATRRMPPLPLERLRAAGQLLLLERADLALTRDETGQLLEDQGIRLPGDALSAVHERTEGWAAGVNLAAPALATTAGVEDRRRVATEIRGSSRSFAGYFAEVVLDPLDPPVRDLLIETSILDRVCGPLADAVTGRQTSATALDDLERANRFVSAIDDGGHWYRYHRLFRDLLRSELGRQRPDTLPRLHRRAAQWLADAGHLDDAVTHAHAAGEPELAAALVASTAAAGLSKRELDVLDLLGRGLSKREVAGELYVSYNTVHSHARSIYRKLGASSRREALARAREHGLVPGRAPRLTGSA